MGKITINQATDILGIIDVQPDFMPGGGLAVAGGDEVVAPVNALLARAFDHAFASQDWHPADHSSFAASHDGAQPFQTVRMPYGEQTLWPAHCVQGTPGADLHAGLDQSKVETVVRKGFRRDVDSYSAFLENDRSTVTGLDGWLRARGFRRLFLTGIATDFCVAFTAEDAARLGYEVFVVEDACRGIGIPLGEGRTTIDAARERLAGMGVRFVTSADIA